MSGRSHALCLCLGLSVPWVAEAQEIQVVEYGAYGGTSSWNRIAGGIGSDTLEAELGFSTLGVAYHHALAEDLTLGGMVGFDYALFAPADAFGAAAILAAPLRLSLAETARYGFTLHFAPGLYLGFGQESFSQFIPGLWLEAGLSGGYRVDHDLLVGGGVDVPFIAGIPTGGRDTFVAVPILIGPMVEWQMGRDVALTAEVKVGPHIMSDDFYGTRFAARIRLGLAYRL